MTEAAGIATVVIGIKAFQSRLATMRLPRLVITPYPLSRPLGAPFDVAAQRHTLSAALTLLSNAQQGETLTALAEPYHPPRN